MPRRYVNILRYLQIKRHVKLLYIYKYIYPIYSMYYHLKAVGCQNLLVFKDFISKFAQLFCCPE